MRYQLLATDYDGTLARGGRVAARTSAILRDVLATGRRLVLVTGRELGDLQEVYGDLGLFERVVAENGAVLYRPATKEQRRLAEPPSSALVTALRERGVAPLDVGASIVATREPHSTLVLDTIRELGLELQVIFNRGAVMILPAGTNKATGLMAALEELKISPRNVVGVGDAENDQSFLKLCERSAAVGDALPAVREAADILLGGRAARGVRELAARLIANDLADAATTNREQLAFGTEPSGAPVTLEPYGDCLLICGASASGKSTVARRIVESLQQHEYQFCLIDPEGDYEEHPGAVILGKADAAPLPEEVMQLLEDYGVNSVVCMTAVPISDRPAFFASLLSDLLAMRVRYGRPHWLVIDEAHHLLPGEWRVPEGLLPDRLRNVVLVTVHPELLSRTLLQRVTQLVAVGPTGADIVRQLAALRDLPLGERLARSLGGEPLAVGEVLLWSLDTGVCRRVRVDAPSVEHRRHTRKYAVGHLPPDRSFYFRGPENRLNLRAQNLLQFLELASGVDEDTWNYHFERGDYSRWFRDVIKDEELAADAVAIEQQHRGRDSRGAALDALKEAIESRYTLPADAPMPVRGAS